jgi:hypothetical protein
VVSTQLEEEEIEEDGLEGEAESKKGNPKDIHPRKHQKTCDIQAIRAFIHRIVQPMVCQACQYDGSHQTSHCCPSAVGSTQIVGKKAERGNKAKEDVPKMHEPVV